MFVGILILVGEVGVGEGLGVEGGGAGVVESWANE